MTSAGWYYVRFLAYSFAYLDLVLQDTPVNNFNVARRLRDSVDAVDNLGDREDNKVERLAVRFERVRVFLSYLETEEERERNSFIISDQHQLFGERIVPRIREKFEQEREWIERRVRENREKDAEELSLDPFEDEAKSLGVETKEEPET